MNFISLFFLLVAGLASAHTTGFTYETVSGDYFVDIGAPKSEFRAGELALFEFNIYHKSDPNNLADFDNVYVTFSDASRVLVSTYVHRPEDSLTVFSYDFPHSGEYSISARFQNGSANLSEVTFPVTVMGGAQNLRSVAGFIAVGILCLASGWWLGHRRPAVN